MAAHRSPAGALPLPEATPTFVAPAGWQAIDFISDLHLAENTPRAFAAWAAHLRHTSADAVFILGDLFEVWVGDDMANHGFEARCAALLSEAAALRTVGFMAGNRDFLVGDAMLEASGVLRLRDPTLLSAFGTRVLASHGDALCLDDTAYQRYRSVVRRPSVQRTFLALPLAWRRAIGRKARRRSETLHMPGLGAMIDVDTASVSQWLRQARSPVLVHGHTHAPAMHEIERGVVRHVLSDWELDAGGPPRAEVLRWTARGFARVAPQIAPVSPSNRP
ncbi:MAG: UDP-2,3-diacylglucosamine diphosphatase [Caldimonas sp.]